MAVRYDTLANHYETIFILMHEHKWSYSDIQNMMPFERDIFLIFLKQSIEKRNAENKQRAS